MRKQLNILFICTGNTCRSPMAKVIADKMIAERGLNIRTDSAGLTAFDGDFPAMNAVKVMERRGIDMDSHRAKPLTPSMCKWATYIFVMTQRQLDGLLTVYPQYTRKASTLSVEDIEDPYGQNMAAYEKAADELEAAIEKRLIEIENEYEQQQT